MFIKESVKERALSSIVDTTKCINYPTLANGYGVMQTYVNGKKKHYLMHRVAYQLFYGDDLTPEDIICHKYDNPKCINPKHLFKGTHADNVRDKVMKGRQAKGCKNGRYIDGRASDRIVHKSIWKGSLTPSRVHEVKVLIDRGVKLIEISSILNVPYQTVRDIKRGRSYNGVS